jgi:hypothetical protein
LRTKLLASNPVSNQLSGPHQRFCEEYVKDFDVGEAYSRGGHKARGESAKAAGCRSWRVNTKCAKQGLVLIDSMTDSPIAIMDAAIQNAIRWLMPCTLEFQFEDDRGLWQVHIVGADAEEAKEKMKFLQMRLIGGKRELLHCGSKQIIKAIRGTKVADEEKEGRLATE